MSITSELSIDGMTCASCAAHVAAALRKVPGVDEATVNLAAEQARVVHDPGVALEALVGAVEAAGYQAAAASATDSSEDAVRRSNELARKRRLLLVGAILTVPTVILAMAVPDFVGKSWIEAVLTLPVWAVVGWEFHRGALASLRAGNATMDTLVSLGSTAAFALSLYLAAAGRAPYFETAAAIITLVYAGKVLEATARSRSNRAIAELLALRPERARRRRDDGSIESIPVEDVAIGDLLAIAPGERIPVDGTVTEGASAVDRSMLTGESMPVDVNSGDAVEAGTLNADGALLVRATAVGAGTALARIVDAVRRAQGSAPPAAQLADRVAGIFVPIVMTLSALTFAGWLVARRSWVEALVVAVAVLVVACPCALGLATPTAIIAGIGVAARRGILFRDAATLERVAVAGVVVFDKTGTLTAGKPAVTAVRAFDGATREDVLQYAAAIEAHSMHPLALAIVADARSRGVSPQAAGVREIRGSGASGSIADENVDVGSASFLASMAIGVDEPAGEATTVYVARDGRAIGAIELADEVRPTSRDAVEQLRELGVASVIVSGDADAPTAKLAGQLGIATFHAGVSPEGKARIVEDLRRGEPAPRVAFVGDGINDAPALATADAGFAMGNASAAAIEASGAAVLSNDPAGIPAAIRVARATMRTIRVNLFWAFAYNVVLIPLAAFGIVDPMFAAAAMGASSLFVVGNSLLLSRRRAA